MKPENQRIAIAEAHTSTRYKWLPNVELFYRVNQDGSLTQETPPDYLNDLNACREMVSVLTTEQKTKYRETLCVLTLGEGGPIDATADQRTEAFLRTIDKWTDG